MSTSTPPRPSTSRTSTPASIAPSASISNRGSLSSSRPSRPPLQPRWTSSSASSFSGTRRNRDRAFSIESKATITRPAALRSNSGRVVSLGGDRGSGLKVQLAQRPGDIDLLQLRPNAPADHGGVDALFVQFPVKEIRHVEERARDGAEAKREELRLMVGERYRDLLSAADSIVRMRKSATSLLTRLEVAQHDCTHEELDERARTGRRTHRSAAGGGSRTPYTTATLVKLLLDSPEHVWRAIERSDFLAAARLEAVARAVYRALAGSVDEREEGDEVDELTSSFPLVEQQWENILQLGPQIFARARAALQHHEMSTQDTVETLAAIIMVENVALPDSLTLLLDMRTRALASTFDSNASSPSASPVFLRKSSFSHEHDSIEDTLQHAVTLVMRTVEHVKQAYLSDSGSPVRLLDVLEDLQVAPEIEETTFAPEKTRRLSAGQLLIGKSSARSSIIETLPNAHTLFRYLPPQVLTFTPFINTSVPSDAEQPAEQLQRWLQTALDQLRQGIEHILGSVTSATRLVTLRSSLSHLWQEQTLSTEASAIRSALNDALESRFTQTYESDLAELVQALPRSLHAALSRLPTSAEDLDVSTFVYSSTLAFPSTSAIAASSASDLRHPFRAFDDAIDKRLNGRTPLIDRVLRGLEDAAEALHADLHGWLKQDEGGRALATYRAAVARTFEAIERVLRDLLAERADDVTSNSFIGAFARCLSETSDFADKLILADLPSSDATDVLASLRSALEAISVDSLALWHETTVTKAVAIVEDSLKALAAGDAGFDGSSFDASNALPNGHADNDDAPISLPSAPSSALSSALYTLVGALEPRRVRPAAARKLISDFTDRASKVVVEQLDAVAEGQIQAVVLQVLFDVIFLRGLTSDDVGQEAIEALSTKIGPSYGAIRELIDDNAATALRRQQTLLSSLLPESSSTAFLPLGPSSIPSEFRSPLGVATPGPRLGLVPLLVGGTR